jgi:hypothetical protein
MPKSEAQARQKIVHHLQRSQREAVRHRREARRVDARERIDQSAQLDRVSRVCISTIQRLYSMLLSFSFWLKMFTARRDQHEETGSACWRFNEVYSHARAEQKQIATRNVPHSYCNLNG